MIPARFDRIWAQRYRTGHGRSYLWPQGALGGGWGPGREDDSGGTFGGTFGGGRRGPGLPPIPPGESLTDSIPWTPPDDDGVFPRIPPPGLPGIPPPGGGFGSWQGRGETDPEGVRGWIGRLNRLRWRKRRFGAAGIAGGAAQGYGSGTVGAGGL